MAAEGSALTSRLVRHRAASRRTAASGDDEPAPPSKAVDDARDEVVNPPPAEAPNATPEPTLAQPKVTVLHTVPVQEADAAAPVSPPPASGAQGADQPRPDELKSDQPRSDQPTPDQQAPPHVDVEKLLKDAPAPADDAASAAVATPVAAPVATTGGEGQEKGQEKGQENGQEKGMASWLGVLLMALGAAALLSSSRTVRHALRSVRWPGAGAELPVVAHAGHDDLAVAPERIRFAGTRRDELFRYDPRSMAPLGPAARSRRNAAAEPPAREAF
jgi:hypothetical protein